MQFNLDYFYGNEAGQFRFYRIPKALFAGDLSLEAATLYGLMVDRVGLSAKNGWIDNLGRVFIYFIQKDVQKYLRCGHNRATAFMRELERFGLIERKRQGLGKPAKIYVKNFTDFENEVSGAGPNKVAEAIQYGRTIQSKKVSQTISAAQKEAVKTAQNRRLRVPAAGIQDCPEQVANDTKKKEIKRSETNHILPHPPHTYRKPPRSWKTQAELRWVREEIRENIDYEGLVMDHPYDQGMIDGYVELMTETACSSRNTVRICGEELPTVVVRNRFLKLERSHIEYVQDCLCHTTRAIGNIKAYTLAALYNAPVTMEQYYATLVGRDMSKQK